MRKEPDRREIDIAILCCFFLSGSAGLVYQVAWAKALGLIFGHTVYATAVVLAVFMAGLACGSVYLGRRAEGHANPVALYARIEFLIAATGALSLAGLAAVRSLYVVAYPVVSGSHLPLLAPRLFGVTAVLFIPTMLMGATLPILVDSFVRSSANLGVSVSQLYWVNTLGAVAGTLIAGFVLLPTWGLRATICCAAAVNTLAGLIALWVSKENRTATAVKIPPRKVNPDRNDPQQSSFRFLLFLFAVVGSTAFAYEIAWTRLLAVTIGSSTYAFTLMLAAFLLGIGLSDLGAAGPSYIVALGASGIHGKGVPLSEAFPAQIENMLKADGYNIQVINAGVDGDTTTQMLFRMDSVIPPITRITIVQPGTNDFQSRKHGLSVEQHLANIEAIVTPERNSSRRDRVPAYLASLPLDQINPEERVPICPDFKGIDVVGRRDRQHDIKRASSDVISRDILCWCIE